MTTTYISQENRIGPFNPNIVDTVQAVPVGTRTRAVDSNGNACEFIYLQGVASCLVGSSVSWDAAMVTALTPIGVRQSRPIAIATAAVSAATSFGWFQIAGRAVAKKTTWSVSLVAGANVGMIGVGLVGASVSGKEVFGAAVDTLSANLSTNKTVILCISNPHMTGAIAG